LLELISQARISNITVFLEVEAREQTTTSASDDTNNRERFRACKSWDKRN
jgi:hypothetical protein